MLLRVPIRGALGWAILSPPIIGIIRGSTKIVRPAPSTGNLLQSGFSPAPRAGAVAVSLQTAASQVWVRQVVDVLNNTLRGKLNALTTITFNANAGFTLLTDPRIGPTSFIHLMPTTADAAAENGTWYVASQTDGSATINHTNSAVTDRTYRVCIFG